MRPAALTAAAQPLDCTTWRAAMAVITARVTDDPAAVRSMGWGRFQAAVRRDLEPLGRPAGRLDLHGPRVNLLVPVPLGQALAPPKQVRSE